MFHATVSQVHGSSATGNNPCKAATAPNLIGKQVKELSRITHKVGNDNVTSIAITFADGTKVMGISGKPTDFTVPKAGAFYLIDANGCSFVAS